MAYTVVMKAKPGEFEAVGALRGPARQARAVFEVCPEPDPDAAADKVVAKCLRHISAGSVIGLDCGAVDQLRPYRSTRVPFAEWVADQLRAAKVKVIPVVRLSDPDPVRASLARVVAMHSVGATLRLGDMRADPPARIPAGELSRLLSAVGVARSNVHLVVDLFTVNSSRDVARAKRVASDTLTWAVGVGGWASITALSGAFPDQISDLPTGTFTDLERFDARLWRGLQSNFHNLDFGDYAVNHPGMPGAGRGPLPNLRYTNGREWRIWRERKNRPGNESFYDLCDTVVKNSAYSGSTYSWGDEQIDMSAREVRGAGTATQWRAFGTNHHITTVMNRLATLGEP